jgi:hypothetical protein
MNPTLAAIRARLAEIAKIREALDAEQSELATAERVVSRLEVPTATAAEASPAVVRGRIERVRLTKDLTHEDMVRSVLRNSPDPWFASSTAVGAEIERTYNVTINPNSLQPLLWNLKKDGVVVRDNQNRVALADRVVPNSTRAAAN